MINSNIKAEVEDVIVHQNNFNMTIFLISLLQFIRLLQSYVLLYPEFIPLEKIKSIHPMKHISRILNESYLKITLSSFFSCAYKVLPIII